MTFSVTTPSSIDELLKDIADRQNTNFRFGAGMTDLLIELKQQNDSQLSIINLAKIDHPIFNNIERTDDYKRIGSLVTAAKIIENSNINILFPILHKAAESMASRQIRQVATIGGNICTASPAGDIATALVALESICEILTIKNEVREVPINEFFTGVRKTVLKKNEILRSVKIPLTKPALKKNVEQDSDFQIISDFIKVGTRRSMECAIVSLAYHFLIDSNQIINYAGIAIGSSAPTIQFTRKACDFLIGKKITDLDVIEIDDFANLIVEYASPISDVRGSAWYRKQVLYNISKSILEF